MSPSCGRLSAAAGLQNRFRASHSCANLTARCAFTCSQKRDETSLKGAHACRRHKRMAALTAALESCKLDGFALADQPRKLRDDDKLVLTRLSVKTAARYSTPASA